MDPSEVCVLQSEDVHAEGGVALVAFPGQSLAATLATGYLAEALALRPIGRLDCSTVQAVAIVEQGEVIHPIRLLFGLDGATKAKAHPLVAFLSEVPLDENTLRPAANVILDWCQANGIKTLITMESATAEGEPPDQLRLWGIANHAAANKRLVASKLAMAKEGVLTGLTGAILDLGLESEMDIIALVAVGGGMESDVRAASRIVEFVSKFLGLPVPLARLRRETERFEKHLKDIERRRNAGQPGPASDTQEFI